VASDDRPVAVVTGANRGIGREVVRQLAEAGYRVVLGARDEARGRAAAEELGVADAGILACALDVADEASVRAAARRVEDEFGRCDALVNNAAIDYDTDARATTADLDRVYRALETNLFGAWRTALVFLPLLRRSPHPRLVNVSSGGGSISEMGAGTPAYSVSKAALNALTRILAAELRRDRVLVNAVCPGWVATDMGGAGGRPVEDGAASVVWAVLLDDDGPTARSRGECPLCTNTVPIVLRRGDSAGRAPMLDWCPPQPPRRSTRRPSRCCASWPVPTRPSANTSSKRSPTSSTGAGGCSACSGRGGARARSTSSPRRCCVAGARGRRS
jgi:NAD(P)-dependent dehydrogenase (short-subunit alcohol dehydrogenase family)